MDIKICNSWDGYLERFPSGKKDVYYTEGYSKLYEDDESTALCIVCEGQGNILLMPFLRREFNGLFDFETAYGYGGPISSTDDQEWIDKALAGAYDCLRNERYICGFIRFHPLLGNARYCRNSMEVMEDRHTVVVDLRPKEEEIWEAQISSKNRNMIRKAEKLGVRYDVEYDFASIGEFVALYNRTMGRLGAEDFYYFGESYYRDYAREMTGKGFLGMVRLGQKVIGAALFMYSDRYAHYHLAGSDREYATYGINNFLLWNTIKELKKKHVEEFHLGGGRGASEDDSLFKFKKSFSRNTRNFCIGKCIYNKEEYDKACREWERKHTELIPVYGNRLLKYRYGEKGYE